MINFFKRLKQAINMNLTLCRMLDMDDAGVPLWKIRDVMVDNGMKVSSNDVAGYIKFARDTASGGRRSSTLEVILVFVLQEITVNSGIAQLFRTANAFHYYDSTFGAAQQAYRDDPEMALDKMIVHCVFTFDAYLTKDQLMAFLKWRDKHNEHHSWWTILYYVWKTNSYKGSAEKEVESDDES